jgi:hypothetical protein
MAQAFFAKGWLWSSFVMVGKVSILAAAAGVACPQLEAHWRHGLNRAVVEDRPSIPDEMYASAPIIDFSRAVLERLPSNLAVVPLPLVPRDYAPHESTPHGALIHASWRLRPGYTM